LGEPVNPALFGKGRRVYWASTTGVVSAKLFDGWAVETENSDVHSGYSAPRE
jgi:hypothetical protein